MDARRFDRLSRAFGARGSRRHALTFLSSLPVLSAVSQLLEGGEVSADGSGAGIGGNRNHHRNRKAHQHRRSHEPRREKTCQPKSKAKTCADKCGTVRNNCKKRVDCGPCGCESTCPLCQICDLETLACVPDLAIVGESCGDGQVCQEDGTCACSEDTCGACRTCGDGGACQECSGCCDGIVCIDACDCGQECCDGLCCAGGEVCQNDDCCARDCTAVACGSGAPETCGVANCGTCSPGLNCIAGACEEFCTPGACPQGCENCLTSPDGAPICVTSAGSACTGFCQDDSDCCDGTTCAAHPFACNGQFVCYLLGDPCED